MSLDEWRGNRLVASGLATRDDSPILVDALLRLRAAGARSEIVNAAARCLRSRPIVPGEWLIVTGDGHAYRLGHCCLDDETPFDDARVLRLGVASSGADGAAFLPVARPPVAPDHGAAGSIAAPPQLPPPGGSIP